jgi:hypothetical protein
MNNRRAQNSLLSWLDEDPGLKEGKLPWLKQSAPSIEELVVFAEHCADQRELLRDEFDPRARMARKTYDLLESSRLRFAACSRDRPAAKFKPRLDRYRHTQGLAKHKSLYPDPPSAEEESEGEGAEEGQALANSSEPNPNPLLSALSDLKESVQRAQVFKTKNREHKKRKQTIATEVAVAEKENNEDDTVVYAETPSASEDSDALSQEHHYLQSSLTNLIERTTSQQVVALTGKRDERRFPTWELATSRHLDGFEWLNQVMGSYVRDEDEFFEILASTQHVTHARGLLASQLAEDRVARFRLWLRVRDSCQHLSNSMEFNYHKVDTLLREGLPSVLEVQSIGAPTGDQVWNDTLAKITQAISAYMSKLKFEELNPSVAGHNQVRQVVRQTQARTNTAQVDWVEETGETSPRFTIRTPPAVVRNMQQLSAINQPQVHNPIAHKTTCPAVKRSKTTPTTCEVEKVAVSNSEHLARMVANNQLHQVSMDDRKHLMVGYAYELASAEGCDWHNLSPSKKRPWKEKARSALQIKTTPAADQPKPAVSSQFSKTNRRRKRPTKV